MLGFNTKIFIYRVLLKYLSKFMDRARYAFPNTTLPLFFYSRINNKYICILKDSFIKGGKRKIYFFEIFFVHTGLKLSYQLKQKYVSEKIETSIHIVIIDPQSKEMHV